MPHGGNRRAVVESTHTLDHRLVRNTESQQEAISRLLREAVLAGERDTGFAVVDRRDARRDVQLFGVRQQPTRQNEGVLADGFRNPQRAVAKRFDALCRLRRGRRV